MEVQLAEAAKAGDVKTIYAALRGDPSILELVEGSHFMDTPLHIAAGEGQVEFAMEMMILKPSLGRKLNQNGYTPMHLALKKGHEEVVRGLLGMDSELLCVKGKKGRTPLHYAVVVRTSHSLLGEVMEACPNAIKELTTKRETALHICVKSDHDEYDAFRVLLEGIKASKLDTIFSFLDDEGYTVLHHAIFRRQHKMIKLLFQEYHDVGSMVGVNIKARNGLTALDILEKLANEPINSKIKWRLKLAGALRERDRFYHSWFRTYTFTRINLEAVRYEVTRYMSSDTRDAMLVVVVLIISAMFQLEVNPTGGFWQDDGEDEYGIHYIAGTPIMCTKSAFLCGISSAVTAAGLFISLLMIKILIHGLPMILLLHVSILSLYGSYLLTYVYYDDSGPKLKVTFPVWAAVMFALYFVDFIPVGRRLQPFVLLGGMGYVLASIIGWWQQLLKM